jgi:hypothetical protein
MGSKAASSDAQREQLLQTLFTEFADFTAYVALSHLSHLSARRSLLQRRRVLRAHTQKLGSPAPRAAVLLWCVCVCARAPVAALRRTSFAA